MAVSDRSKLESIMVLVRDSHNERHSNTSAKRVFKAAKHLGLTPDETVALFQYLEYASWDTACPYSGGITRIW